MFAHVISSNKIIYHRNVGTYPRAHYFVTMYYDIIICYKILICYNTIIYYCMLENNNLLQYNDILWLWCKNSYVTIN